MTDFGVILLHCYLCTPIHPRHTSDSVSSLILCYWGGLQDIDLVGEMGKQPGDSPAGGIEGTPLMMVIQSMMVHGDVVKFRKDKSLIHTKPRSFFKTLQFLLSVGADPNRQGTDEDGITPIRSHSQLCCPLANTHTHTHTHTHRSLFPALHQAVAISDEALAKKTCMLLLQHKADANATFTPYSRGKRKMSLPNLEAPGTEGDSVRAQVCTQHTHTHTHTLT